MAYEPPASAFTVAPLRRAPRRTLVRRSRAALALAALAALALGAVMQNGEARAAAIAPVATAR